MNHGEIKIKYIKVGSGHIYKRTIRYCAACGEIDLFTCADWDAKHGKCFSPPATHGNGLEIPKAMKKAA